MRQTVPRTGTMHVAWMAFLASVVALAALIGLLVYEPRAAKSSEPLVVYCAAGIKGPVEKIAREYEATYDIKVLLDYAGSQSLLSRIIVNPHGDLFLPADDSYIHLAREKDLLEEVIPVARMTAVIAVRKGNPKQIRGLKDLFRDDVQVAQADPDTAAVGKLTRDTLRKIGRWDELHRRTKVYKPTVNDVANDIKVGAVDAGIIWDATLKAYDDLEAVPVAELSQTTAHIPVAVLRSTDQPTAALHFARFLAAPDRGLTTFAKHGFQSVEGDAWAEKPEINFLGGAMLRPAVEQTITAFEEREGCRVNRIYNGCGILVAQMKAGERPDMYFACDQSFMAEVTDLFLDAVDVSTNQLVILVPKGNPHRIKTLRDLGKPGLKIGVGHEKQCALGVITQTTLVEAKVKDPIMKNVKVQLPTGDMLVNELRVKALDAVIAYVSNATGFGNELEAIAVDIPCAVAVQPVAVGRHSKYPQLAGRLLAALRSQASREHFEANGFRWQKTEK